MSSKTQMEDCLIEKLKNLTLEEGSTKKFLGPHFDGELKSTLKEVSKLDYNGNAVLTKKISDIVHSVLNVNCKVSQTQMSNALVILKSLGEIPLAKTNNKEKNQDGSITDIGSFPRDPFWTEIILPNLAEIYDFVNNIIFAYCSKTMLETVSKCSSLNEGASSSGGFARYQLLGLLQKGIRTLIVYLKRGTLNPETWTCENSSIICTRVNDIGNGLCDFLGHSVDVGLDIRCNIGLALSYIIFHNLKGDTCGVIKYFESIFAATPNVTSEENNGLLMKILTQSAKDVNRIGLAVGVLCTMNFEDDKFNFSSLMYLIGKNILEIDNGTKEAINLGSARVLEMWTEKLANPSTSLKTLEMMSPLFGPLEFFVFNYIPGHIDAVKNCCRNILGALTRIYDRVVRINSVDLIEELLLKIISKLSHVKWIALACVAKNSAQSVKVLKLENDIPVSLLCVQRTIKNSANESYIALMSYEFSTLPFLEWEKRWINPLFMTQPSQDKDSNWSQKRTIISIILNSEKRSPNLQVLINPLLKFVIHKVNSKIEVDEISNSNDEKIAESALLATETIKIASELGLKIDIMGTSSVEDSFRGLVPRKVLHSWLWNESEKIRLAGFSLLVETKKSTELISKEDFESLTLLFKYNLVTQNPAFRQQFISYFKKLLRRLKDSLTLIKRQKDAKNLQHYDDFFRWLWTFLTGDEGLYIGANFGRRYQSLDCLTELVTVFEDVSLFGVKSEGANMKYLHWLTDSYENNKIRALKILEKIPLPSFEDLVCCEMVFQEALNLCQSIRPPDSVTGRYLMLLLMKKSAGNKEGKFSALYILNSLLSKLEETYLKIQASSLTEVSSETPMYGLIRCIWMILSSTDEYLKNSTVYREYLEKLIDLCLKYDSILFPVLGNAAPEGFIPGLPDSMEENSQVVRSITAQMLLVCSWRSMRDICLMLADLCVIFPLEGEKIDLRKNPSGKYILTCEQVKTIGDHLLYLLKYLMHRGVFEQVYVGFKTFSTRLWKSSNPKLSSLPEIWLKEAMDDENMSSKSITRRSGGLPFIFQALLSAECDNEDFMSNWVQRLFFKDESPENSAVRIHSLNVIRGLFKNADFSRAMMPFVPDGLRIAFRGLKSPNWTERNSGLMLYGALMRMTFGPNFNLMSAPTFFRKFPQMYDFLLGELDICLNNLKKRASKGNAADDKESNSIQCDFTFHLLLLLSSFTIVGRVEDNHFRLGEFIPKLKKCAASPEMEVRKLAARAIIPFLISPEDKKTQVLSILKYIKDSELSKMSLNLIHGCLIQIATIIAHIPAEDSMSEIITSFADVLSSPFFWKIQCPTIYSTVAEILLAINKFSNLDIMKIYNKLDLIFYSIFDKRIIKHSVPGLSVADACLSRTKIVFTFSMSKSDDFKTREVIYNWFLNVETSGIFIEQLLVHLCDKNSSTLVENTFNQNCETEGAILLECLVKRYMCHDIKHIGQSDVELKFLELMSLISDKTYNSFLKSEETKELVEKLNNRLILICEGETSTTGHKHFALRVISILSFETEVGLNSPEHQETLIKLLVEWSNSTTDDDLRHAAALSIPKIPFQKLDRFSVNQKSLIWLATIRLAQDDDEQVRSIINSKLPRSKPDKVYCDRKSLEKLVAVYFKNFIHSHPLEGLTLLLGILLRDDFEIKAEEADDDEERLFDKSEMNFFSEPVIFARIVYEYLKMIPLNELNFYKEQFDKYLDLELVELYELSNNSKLFICNVTLKIIIDVLKAKVEDTETVNGGVRWFSIISVSQTKEVQTKILKIVEESFL